MLQSLVDFVIHLMDTIGAPGVGIAILLENIFPPIPSEVILPLAGFTASAGSMNVYAAFVWATAGSVLGAFLLYGLGAAVGAARLRRIADWMWLVNPKDVDTALNWFEKYGQWSVLFGRWIPGVRSLISIPAGVARMNLWKFGAMTVLGSAIWNAALISCGVWLGARWTVVESIIGQYSNVVYLLLIVALIAVIMWLIVRDRRERRAKRQSPADIPPVPADSSNTTR